MTRNCEAPKRDPSHRGRPHLAGRDRRDPRQRAGRDDLASGQGRIYGIVCQQLDEVAQGGERSTQDMSASSVVDDAPIALRIDLEGRQRPEPLPVVGDRMPRPEQQGRMHPKGRHGIDGGDKLPKRVRPVEGGQIVGGPIVDVPHIGS